MAILKTIIIFLLFCCSVGTGLAQPIPDDVKTSHDIEVSLLTCSPGKEIYTAFGHSLIRLYFPATQKDIVFAPNFNFEDFSSTFHYFWRFLDGSSPFHSSFLPTELILQVYQEKKTRRLIEEQIRLTEQERLKLFLFLQESQGREKEERFHFFFNNCSTQNWKAIEAQIQDPLYHPSSIQPLLSFRQIGAPYFKNHPWLELAVSIILGMPADRTASFREQMFLSDYLSRNMRLTFRKTPSGDMESLLGPRRILVEKQQQTDKAIIINPAWILWPLFGCILLITCLPVPRIIKSGVDYFLYTCTGLIGLYLIYLWWHSYYQVMDANLDLLWASPLTIGIVACKLFSWEKATKYLVSLYIISIIVLLAGWSILPQQFHPCIVPISLALLTRSIANAMVPHAKP